MLIVSVASEADPEKPKMPLRLPWMPLRPHPQVASETTRLWHIYYCSCLATHGQHHNLGYLGCFRPGCFPFSPLPVCESPFLQQLNKT